MLLHFGVFVTQQQTGGSATKVFWMVGLTHDLESPVGKDSMLGVKGQSVTRVPD